MRVAIAGGSGFLGRALTRELEGGGHTVSVLTRRARPGQSRDIAWTPNGRSGPWAHALAEMDAVVNLAGAGIADARWTQARKQLLLSSRLDATTSLVAAMHDVPTPPAVFVSGSGVGYYGPTGDERITEDAPAGHDFLGDMAAAWEHAAQPAAAHARVVLLRTGLVMGAEGALAKMLPAFKLGVGGRLGSGAQWMPWISVDDWAALAARLIADDRASGPFNLSAPEPVTNVDFTRTLGAVLGRPTILPVPAFALKLVLGELSIALLTGQRAVPAKALALGYAFRHAALGGALAAALGRA
ncbi:MAG: TIGR01777 family oxidoreductase [Acidobacteria bacterium]|jgi:uncharacterized protein (TIGR01777 family)|nr:TIGR01777 family oxidoreductase [Acidobacteriota bacterium]